MTEENGDVTFNVPDSFTYAAVGTFVGSLAVMSMLITSFLIPEDASSIDRPRSIAGFTALAQNHSTEILTFTTLDTVFLVGYTSLFVGLYLIVRDFSDVMAKLAFGLGLAVGFFDLLENALIFTLIHGINAGWTPEPGLYQTLFALNMFIDLISYAAALLFTILYLSIFRPGNRKFVLGILLGIYVFIGLTAMIWPSMLLVRSVFFVLGLFTGTYVLYQEEDFPVEKLQELYRSEQQGKNDFIR